MPKYRYIAYYDIPGEVISFIENVSGMNVHSLTMSEINNFLNDTNDWYEINGQKIEDFLK